MNTSSRNKQPLDDAIVRELESIFGTDSVLTDPADCWAYGYDNSRRQALPQAVVFATEQDQIVNLAGLCNRHKIPLICRGKGTGTTGATVPTTGGITLSLERMNRIVSIRPEDRLAIVQPGVINAELQTELQKHGFFWPPDPTSAPICTVGGNLAYNSAGPRAVKYGTPRENTLGLKAVTALGEKLKTGVCTSKGVVGYDLTRLLIGSEGTLAIITEAILKLTPLPETKRSMQAAYRDIHSAAKAVAAIMAQPVTPCTLEFMDAAALNMVRNFSELALDPQAGALLMIEVDGPAHSIEAAAEAVQKAASLEGLLSIQIAETEDQVAALWKTRKALSPALRNVAPKKINEDVVVPVSRIPDLIGGLAEMEKRTGIKIVNFGHAGNGNIHVNLLLNPDDPEEMKRGEECLNGLFDLVLKLDGTLSGEHGVGLAKRDFIDREIDPATLRLMRDIKQRFDPNGILNPGKMLPPEM